jgi:hypothetical protein
MWRCQRGTAHDVCTRSRDDVGSRFWRGEGREAAAKRRQRRNLRDCTDTSLVSGKKDIISYKPHRVSICCFLELINQTSQ